VGTWWWELWNEPDISYWQGTVAEYCDLYRVTVEALDAAAPGLLVGGPATTGGGPEFLREFLQYVSDNALRIDFASFHTKGATDFEHLYAPVGPDGAVSDQRISPDTDKMLREVTTSLDIIRSFDVTAQVPVFVDECDADVPAHFSAYDNPNYALRNTEYYPVFQLH
jgi:xylan 1,4-beta-xylosidase